MPTLHWIGKEKVINHHQDVPYKILEKQYTYSNGKESKDTWSENKIIQGDNLEALKSLLPEYEGKINCIYIDPPYNTGNEGWVYNDNVSHPKLKKWLGEVVGKEGEDLTRHDKWLCMMYPRLKLLHKLLAEDGAIFISIDDNEQSNLKLICDEIFGGVNFLSSLIWEKKYSPQNDAIHFSGMHDFILAYAKSSKKWKRNLLPRTEKQNKAYRNPDNDIRGLWKSSDLTRAEHRERDFYPIITPSGRKAFPAKGRSWSRPPEEIKRLREDNRLWFGINGDAIPSLKRFLSEVKSGVVPSSIFKREDAGDNQEAKQDLKLIFGKGVFPFETPKPSRLIERILRIGANQDSIVLDSFAGSGTTAHAVLNLNKEDNGNRKFILVEMENYANTITAERVKRVISGYGKENKTVGGTGGDFSYYALGESLFLKSNVLNEEVGVERIKEYVWYSETRSTFQLQEERYLLGKHNNTAYYFYYEKDNLTTLDDSFLRTIKTKEDQYIIYADNCLLDNKIMNKYHIIFKKIPRDISRF